MTLQFVAVGFLVSFAVAQVDWVVRQPPMSPIGRNSHAMVYDAARGVIVMFGGVRGAVTFGDTWTYDGTTWTLRPVAGPSPRAMHTMAYDAQRQVVVLFGGGGQQGSNNETWEWDGSTWTQRTPAVSPPARTGHASAPFPPLGGIVVHGGLPIDGSPHFWRWDGTTWNNLTSATTPRDFLHGMAYHAGLQRLVVHGREVFASWDGTEWLPADRSAGARRNGGLVYDSLRDRLVAFGGYYDQSFLDPIAQTWVWDGVWAQLEAPSALPALDVARSDFAVAFDAARGRVVVHGGQYLSWGFGWNYDETIELAPATPPPPYAEPRLSGFALTSACDFVSPWPQYPNFKPLLHSHGRFPWIGETIPLVSPEVYYLLGGIPVALVYGASNQSWGGVPLPWPLTALRPGCMLAVEPALVLLSTATNGFYYPLSIPNAPSLVGTEHFFQLFGNSPTGALFSSTGLGLRIGEH